MFVRKFFSLSGVPTYLRKSCAFPLGILVSAAPPLSIWTAA